MEQVLGTLGHLAAQQNEESAAVAAFEDPSLSNALSALKEALVPGATELKKAVKKAKKRHLSSISKKDTTHQEQDGGMVSTGH